MDNIRTEKDMLWNDSIREDGAPCVWLEHILQALGREHVGVGAHTWRKNGHV